MNIPLAIHLKAMERTSQYADFVPVASTSRRGAPLPRVLKPLPYHKAPQLDLFGPVDSSEMEDSNKQIEEIKKIAAIQDRQAAAFQLLGRGLLITQVAKETSSQVNQVYDWMQNMALYGPILSDKVKLTAEEWKVAEARCFKESPSFRQHLQDRLADGLEPEEIMDDYGLSEREFNRLTFAPKPSDARKMEEIAPLMDADFRYENDLPFSDAEDKMPEVPSLRQVAEYLGHPGRDGSNDRMEAAVFHLARNGMLPEPKSPFDL